MKDAFGGAFLLNIMITFFVIFICFMTAAVTLAKTFRIKTEVISFLERNEVTPSMLDDSGNSINEDLSDFLNKMNYKITGDNKIRLQNQCSGTFIDEGICIIPYYIENDNLKRYYYNVTSYFVINFPLFNSGLILPFSGDSKSMIG